MNILLVGSGGREHAIAIKLRESPSCEKLFIAPGNGGTALLGENVPINAEEIERLTEFAFTNSIDLIVVGPEVPLCMGFADSVLKKSKECGKHIAFFGPSKACALLEGSKDYSKQIMMNLNIPTAEYKTFTDFKKAKEYIKTLDYDFVIKADGLAAGKGVILPETKEEAFTELNGIMRENRFGSSGNKVVIEERLQGEEVSILAFSDGKNIAVMPSSQDHKRLKNGDKGPNTGGMGAYAPTPVCNTEKAEEYAEKTILPVIKKMAQNGTPYIGVLYAGLMLTKKGIRVLEYNCRFGDPETQVLMQLFDGDLAETMLACAEGRLNEALPKWKSGFAVTIVMASGGYPINSSSDEKLNKDELKNEKDVNVIHAGTVIKNGELFTHGGRVLCITAHDEDIRNGLQKAIDKAYKKVKSIHFKNAQYRTDIAAKGLKRQEKS
ncbi:phosphoribosylamine--glycine ligase [Treponema pedis]|uniref:phosphoribosylamine--glycine ligase n=1 Tax=Treponema pedis TaxID=409322 RepID=UPI00040D50C9|nr:phosphoribosylamine--glycine ligase [Treponema pedis]